VFRRATAAALMLTVIAVGGGIYLGSGLDPYTPMTSIGPPMAP
jgi:hypothetical protein